MTRLLLALLLLTLGGCDQGKPAPPTSNYAPYEKEADHITAESSWQVGDCYLDKEEFKKLGVSSTPPPPWEKSDEVQNNVHWNRLVAEWDLVNGGQAQIYFQHAYSNRRDMAWFTKDGSIWTVTPEKLKDRIKMPCPKRGLEDLQAQGIEIATLRRTP